MNYTREVFQRLSRGQFISGNSIDPETRAIYNDIEECQQEYEDYFRKIDFYLSAGDGFYYFSRKEPRVNIENKLQSLFSWIDYLDFLKTYDTAFDAGTQFSLAQMEIRLSSCDGQHGVCRADQRDRRPVPGNFRISLYRADNILYKH